MSAHLADGSRPLLEVQGIHTYYGLSYVLFGISFEVRPGECVCLLGRNGAGKTTTMKSVMGLVVPRRGRIRFRGRDILGMPPYRIAREGIGYVPEDRRVFPSLTVIENLEAARRPKPPGRPGPEWTVDAVLELFPPLSRRARQRGGQLSGGEQQMLTIGRTLMTQPELVLLDEPSEGLAPLIVDLLGDRIAELKRMGLTIVLSEQNLDLAARLSDRAYVLDRGEVKATGPIEDVLADDEVKQRYLSV